MFGHQNDQPAQQTDANHIPDQTIDAALGGDHQSPAIMPPQEVVPTDHAAADWQHPGTPVDDSQQTVATPAPSLPAPDPVAHDAKPEANPNDLIDIKQQALNQLSPLVSHLDQSPDEKFRTLMMMIQASDDQSKISEAYATAQQITDEKARAQALLDIINEINYFTQHHDA